MRMKRTQWQEVVDVNLTGVYLCAQVNLLDDLPLPPTSYYLYPRISSFFIRCIAYVQIRVQK